MLRKILEELENAKGPIDISQLSLKLGIERNALEGMLQYLVMTGKLEDNGNIFPASNCSGCPSAAFCGDVQLEETPKTYSIKK
jgi:predicted ArsR family transcriptional regulator